MAKTRKTYRRKGAWPRKGTFYIYGYPPMPPFPPYLPSFWAKCLLLLCLAEEDPEPFERAVQAYWPKRILPLYARIDLDYILRSWDPQETSLEDFIKTRWYNPEAYLGVVELLPLLERWRLEPKEYLLPLVWALAEEEASAESGPPTQSALRNLRFYALLWPRSVVPFHEVTPDPRVPKERGKNLGYRPLQEQIQGLWPYALKPERIARWAAWKQLGATFLEIAKRETGRQDILHGDTIVGRIYRRVKKFLLIAEGKYDPQSLGIPSSGLVQGPSLEEEKLIAWAKEHGPFTVRDLLRKGPKSLRKKEGALKAISHLQSIGLLEWEGGKYRIRHPTPPDKPDR